MHYSVSFAGQWNFWSNISSMRCSVSSLDETLRRELKIRRAAAWRTSRCFFWRSNTMSNAWYYFSNKKILDREIKDVKMSSFSSDYQTLPIYFLAPATQAIDFNFLCIFFTNYRWVWEQGFNKALCSMTLCANHFPILSARTWTNLLGWNRCWLLIFISITPVVFIPTDQINIR